MKSKAEVNRILVAGASGGTGREILHLLWGTGLAVRALTRSQANIESLKALGAAEVVIGDLMEPGVAERAAAGVEAVLCAVGPAQSLRTLLFGALVDDRGVMNLIDTAAQANVSRFVYESTIGVGSSKAGMGAFDRWFLRRSLQAKERAENRLRETGLTYTILRPGKLINDPPTGAVIVSEDGQTTTGAIPRADIARLMVTALFTPDTENRTFEAVSRDGARGEVPNVVRINWPVFNEEVKINLGK